MYLGPSQITHTHIQTTIEQLQVRCLAYMHLSSDSEQVVPYRPGLGAVYVAIWDDLGECDNPVVDLVSSPPLH